MRRLLVAIALPLLLAACGAESVWAPDEAVAAAAYRPAGEAPSITLYTAINNRSEEGGHSSLMINASQRVVFDPAGTWWHRTVPERNDVLYGMTPQMERFYLDYHARVTYRVVEQKIIVSPEVAEMALQLVEANGAVPKAMCANSVSGILSQLPGFESISRTYYPRKISNQFTQLPGVQTRTYFDDDADDNSARLSGQQSDGFRVVEGQPAQ